jgi:hypothetical protein
MATSERFPRLVFLVAAIYGVIVLVPQYVLEAQIGRDYPPPITHPEHFYGFIGVALAWQVAFFIIAQDVRRYRLLIVPAVLEKLAFGLVAIVLVATGRAALAVGVAGTIDLVLAVLFVLAFRAVGRSLPGARGFGEDGATS